MKKAKLSMVNNHQKQNGKFDNISYLHVFLLTYTIGGDMIQ